MKRTSRLSVLVITLSIFIISCQKELDWGIGNKVSVGSLLDDASGNCLGSTPSGTYKKDTVLTANNFISVTVDVDTIGTYTIYTDTVNGYFFRASGRFNTTGPQVVKLMGTGKPLIDGVNTFFVKYNGTICQFSIIVTAGSSGGGGGTSVYTIDCSNANVVGTYSATIAMTPSNKVTLDVDVTTAGSWSLTSATANGISFSGSGTFSATGPQQITLTATNTPSLAGNFNFTVNNGTSSCSFPVTFTAPAVIDWKFTEGSVTYQGSFDDAQLQSAGPAAIFAYQGSSTGGDLFVFGLVDFGGGINANENYNSNSLTSNSAGFSFLAGSGETYSADNTTSGVNITIKVTSHNTGTKTIQGTFSGTVKNAANATKTISNGTFKGTYQ